MLRHPEKAQVAALRLRRSLVAGLLTLAAAFLVAAPAQAQALPPSLQGEDFVAVDYGGFVVVGQVEVSGSCVAEEGESFTITYEARGVASGPYPGTFTESGTVTATTVGFDQRFLATVVTWDANFTIDSVVGDVIGTKTLIEVVPFGAWCVPGNPIQRPTLVADANLHYEATIRTDAGTFTDEGESFAHVQDLENAVGVFEGFTEHFYLSTGVLPVDTSGKATGGGQIVSGSNPLERVTFGFNVRKDESETRLKGTCNVLDHATGTHVKCLTVTDYQQIGNTATWEGTAEVNGVEEEYRITVQDNGEPNQGVDTFSIVTETYDAAGNVQHGNVQLHKQELGL